MKQRRCKARPDFAGIGEIRPLLSTSTRVAVADSCLPNAKVFSTWAVKAPPPLVLALPLVISMSPDHRLRVDSQRARSSTRSPAYTDIR